MYYQLLTLLFILAGLPLSAQQKDFGVWTGLALEKALTKRWDVELEAGYRQKDNLNQWDKWFGGAEVSWSRKFFKAGLLYRYSYENGMKRTSNSHRLGVESQLKTDLDRFTLSYRGRVQAEYSNYESSEKGQIPDSFFRNRVKASYNIKGMPLEPWLSYEMAWRINSYSTRQIEHERYTAGLDYKINKHNAIGISYLLNRRKNVASPQNSYIVSLDYKFKLDRKKK
ncbi:DUF2490 domain-containing protein [Mangrovibacterium diazotrophicum]|uniref:Uncharacterized protein DUF2490 n=1 Tax=Mangrovibacterium diazotrophicum TaxID=1261403 RepID=A0A419W5J6_9BACT|nr:DUF2490 domain-containing protein [Mangrovibacterium diazotrophicum]RKD90732.1 uncharacterized protein DUF2490 [Mangrovibacterium diazotrophicum]